MLGGPSLKARISTFSVDNLAYKSARSSDHAVLQGVPNYWARPAYVLSSGKSASLIIPIITEVERSENGRVAVLLFDSMSVRTVSNSVVTMSQADFAVRREHAYRNIVDLTPGDKSAS
jgi:hypothetical protein